MLLILKGGYRKFFTAKNRNGSIFMQPFELAAQLKGHIQMVWSAQ
jgi:hypothetical protein